MSESAETFDAARAVLRRGVNVVEASAGTGKTYAIAMLVLRFVVEHHVLVDELLVVSYTRAATDELRSRIRSRLLDARDILVKGAEAGHDATLRAYMEGLSHKERSRKRLELAILDMDRAAIFTIHGFCQRMLQEQALESGQLFDMELTADTSQIRKDLVADYWRSHFYELPEFHCSLFLDHFATPDALHATVKGVGADDAVEPTPTHSLTESLALVDTHLEPLRDWWRDESLALEEKLHTAMDGGMFKKGFVDGFHEWWQGCEQFLGGDGLSLPPGLAMLGEQGLRAMLNGSKLRGDVKKNDFLLILGLPRGVLGAFLEAAEAAVLAMRCGLVRELQSGLRSRLLERGLFSFDDLILSLAQALEGPRREELQRVLASRFKVALIDEFQDTDSAQYRIFSSLFATGKKSHFLYLIGDPKQAIYRFRGADIASYFQARNGADFLLGLVKNYRSNPQLVRAVNSLFLHREGGDSFVSSEICYEEVAAAKSAEYLQLQRDGEAQAAMVYCTVELPDDAKAWTSGRLQERLETSVVHEITELLATMSLVGDKGGLGPVVPADIAILVRSNKQAESFQQALSLAGVPAVVFAKKTVFETRECADLLLVLEAVAMPGDLRCLSAALSCCWFGLDGPKLHAVLQDEKELDSWIERFHDYGELWQHKGFLAMMNHLLSCESVFETLCATPLAERQIANIQHLSQLLQEEESGEGLHQTALLHFLSSRMESADSHEEAQLRLESDKEAVKVLTMHAVKGLEYPIVFCPGLWSRPAFLKAEKDCVSFHDDTGHRVSDIGSAHFAERHQEALREELAEETRLLYVAVTRASSRCYVYWANVQGGRFAMATKDSALAWVLSLEGCTEFSEQEACLQGLADGTSVEVRCITAEADVSVRSKVAQQPLPEGLDCLQFSRQDLEGHWLMTSYSALAGGGHVPFVAEPLEGADDLHSKSPRIHSLPMGAGLGNVVHGLLEDYPFSVLGADADYMEECQAQCRRFGVTAESESLMALLRDVTRTTLLGADGRKLFSLMDLAAGDVLKEMPFYFHLRKGTTAEVNEALQDSPVVQNIQERALQGYLIGFIDLVCRHQGKYYVMDYKTNFLGETLGHYSKTRLPAAMHGHNYGLQYWIYTLVLHRYLMATLPDYSYEQDFGGVFYLFARGMNPNLPGNGQYFHRPDITILDKLYHCLGAH
jgi:exodeoxyribonuclease V beta subunit